MYGRFVALATLALVLGAGCAKKAPRVESPAPQSVEVSLQVSSITPATIDPDTPTAAKVFGSAFELGATVSFTGPSEGIATGVEVAGGNTIDLTIPGLPVGRYDVVVENPSGERSRLRGGLRVGNVDGCGDLTIYFDFDRSNLRREARSALDDQMACLQEGAGELRVEGHADERGTVDYNLQLGQRRAEAVKQYLVRNGVAASRVNTVSYGEERPAVRGFGESAWAKNRRAEISATE